MSDPITVLTLMAVSGHDVTPAVSDTLAASVRHRVETLLTARRGPLPAEEIDKIEFEVATELLVLGIAMMSRLPDIDLHSVGDSVGRAVVEMAALRDERRGG